MPLLLSRELDTGLRLGVWKIREHESWFLEQLPLSAEELAELRLMRSQDKREQRLAWRMVISLILGHNSFTIDYDEHRKPHLRGIPGHISVSHSGELAAALYHPSHPAGIDVEKISPRLTALTDKYLSLSECMDASPLRSDELLTIIWSAKEALYKLDGRKGLHFNRDLRIGRLGHYHSGRLSGHILCGEHQGEYPLAWERLEDYVMVYTT
jgi:phosphopantetheinyl transferase